MSHVQQRHKEVWPVTVYLVGSVATAPAMPLWRDAWWPVENPSGDRSRTSQSIWSDTLCCWLSQSWPACLTFLSTRLLLFFSQRPFFKFLSLSFLTHSTTFFFLTWPFTVNGWRWISVQYQLKCLLSVIKLTRSATELRIENSELLIVRYLERI